MENSIQNMQKTCESDQIICLRVITAANLKKMVLKKKGFGKL